MSTSTFKNKQKLKDFLLEEAKLHGFDALAITHTHPLSAGNRLREAIDKKYHATMTWMEETLERRADVRTLWPEARSVIMLAINYGPEKNPRDTLIPPNCGNISVYARHRDYHDLVKGRLKQIASRFAARSGADVKVFVDTAPLMEKPLAEAAGIGWQGKHTNLVNRNFGSWLFLGSIITDITLPYDKGEVDRCGSCQACLNACPTAAFPAPYQLDASRCISYLTIELKEQIPIEFREKIGNRIYGCDDCLAACPWNKFACITHEIKLQPRADLMAPPLAQFLAMDDPTFRTFFSGSPVKRIGLGRFIRNCLIAAGNSKDKNLIDRVMKHIDSSDKIIRGAAIWALGCLMTRHDFNIIKQQRIKNENEPDLVAEWEQFT